MAKTPEGKIQAEVIKYLKDKNIFHFRYNAVSSSFGLPDLIVIYRGYFVGLEIKTPTGRPTLLQKQMKDNIESAGGYYGFITSVEDVEKVLYSVAYNDMMKII